MSATNFGWVLRKNGSCLPSEVDCGETVVPYRVCCPHGSFCPHARNVACCPSKEFCTDTLNGQPHCATPPGVCISTVDTFAANRVPLPMLWMGGRMAVGSPVTSCRQEGSPLSVISAAPTATSSSTAVSTSASSSAPTSTTTTTQPSDGSSSSHSNNTGAIAGGVVGGVVGAAIIVSVAKFSSADRDGGGFNNHHHRNWLRRVIIIIRCHRQSWKAIASQSFRGIKTR